MATRFKYCSLILLVGLFLAPPVMAGPGETVIVVTPPGPQPCVDTGGGVAFCP